jgi:hypothetical protein
VRAKSTHFKQRTQKYSDFLSVALTDLDDPFAGLRAQTPSLSYCVNAVHVTHKAPAM